MIRSLIADEIRSSRDDADLTRRLLAASDDAVLSNDEYGLDSLDIEDCASRVAEFFRTFESGIEDYLLMDRRLGAWADVVGEGLRQGSGRLTFRTSGTTGKPKRCKHGLDALMRDGWHIFGVAQPKRVVSLVAPHHIYGFIYTILAPSHLGFPVVDISTRPGTLSAVLRPGDLVVGNPFRLRNALRTLEEFPEAVSILSSTASLPDDLGSDLASAGAAMILDVLGSSETGALGVKQHPADAFVLMPWWSLDDEASTVTDAGGAAHALQDAVERTAADRFRPVGRLDGIVQIGGNNVDLDAVRSVLLGVSYVRTADVDVVTGNDATKSRLRATISTMGLEADVAEEEIRRHCKTLLHASAIPSLYRILSH